ncbi:MAG: hypothetical protein JW993_16825 [Sedimentisphaerales bacterium]|nr:hypothetical protein [Sedimentisphaerales bacterium]
MRLAMTLLLLALVTTLGGCTSATDPGKPETTAPPAGDSENPPADTLLITGTVRHIPLEGGFYGIEADNNRRYDPVNLPDEFKQDGLPVACRVRILRSRASFHMWGQLVEIVDIRRR